MQPSEAKVKVLLPILTNRLLIFASLLKTMTQMKKSFFLFFSILITFNGFSQFSKDSIELINRLQIFMQYNRELNFDKVMDYVYPKLFTIAPREKIKEAMEAAFQSDELVIKMDSIQIQKVYSVFAVDNNKYSKINYSMQILMKPVKIEDSLDMNMLLTIMQGQYGKENVRINEKTNTLIVHQNLSMAAIKDKHSKEWTFINMKKEDPLMGMLLEKPILDKLNSY